MGEKTGEKKRSQTQSLGWLTESSIMPRKKKEIIGVGPSSILDLKAQLYKSQEDLKRSKLLSDRHVDYQPSKPKFFSKNPLHLKNSGVDSRALKDKLELKAVTDGTASYAALERKALLYEKLAKGELSDEEDKEKYCVDFSSKSFFTHDNSQQSQEREYSFVNFVKGEDDRDDAGSMSHCSDSKRLGQTGVKLDHAEHMRFVREVHEEANEAREKVSELKLRRQEQVTARREKLKQAYLRKQLEKLKAASETQQT